MHNFKNTEFKDNSSESQIWPYQNTTILYGQQTQHKNKRQNTNFGNPI